MSKYWNHTLHSSVSLFQQLNPYQYLNQTLQTKHILQKHCLSLMSLGLQMNRTQSTISKVKDPNVLPHPTLIMTCT